MSTTDTLQDAPPALLFTDAAARKVGDLIRLTGGTFKVVGIYSSGDGFEDAASIVSLSDAQQPPKPSGLQF